MTLGPAKNVQETGVLMRTKVGFVGVAGQEGDDY